MNDDWGELDDQDTNDVEETEEIEEEETEDETEEVTEESAEPEETNEEEELFELTHLGQVSKVNRNEVTTLAQKGMDYDHVKESLAAEKSKVAEYEAFFQEIGGDKSIEDVIDETRASILAQKEGIESSLALQKVKFEREKRAFEASKKAETAANDEEERKNREFGRFSREYPEVDAKTIPADVWQRFANGESLTELYREHENKQLRDEIKSLKTEIETMKQNEKNKSRATGSMKSSGKREDDKIFEGWDD